MGLGPIDFHRTGNIEYDFLQEHEMSKKLALFLCSVAWRGVFN